MLSASRHLLACAVTSEQGDNPHAADDLSGSHQYHAADMHLDDRELAEAQDLVA
jgi:hypothetical protein